MQKKIIIAGSGLALLVLSGVFLFFSFQKNTALENSFDPISQLFEESIQSEKTQNPRLKADFFGGKSITEKPLSQHWANIGGVYYYFGSYNPSSNDITPVTPYSGPISTTLQSCLDDSETKDSADLGFLYATLDATGFEKLLLQKTTNPNFKDALMSEWAPVLGHAMENNQLHWDWVPETSQYIFYPYKGDEAFWYCYFKEESPTFQNMFQTGNFTAEGQAENTLYYISTAEINSYPNTPEEDWANIPSFSDHPLNESFKEYMIYKDLFSATGTEPLRIDVMNNGNKKIAYGVAPNNLLEGVYKHKDTGLCFLSDRDFKDEFYYPVSSCTDAETGDVYTVQIVETVIDTDNDGIPDSIDPDDDNDWYSDIQEIGATPATDPLDANSTPAATIDSDNDGQFDAVDDDDDNDGYTDAQEIGATPPTNPLDPNSTPASGCNGFDDSIFDECTFE